MIPFTHKVLLDWAGPQVFRDAKLLFERGAVQLVSFEPPYIRGTVSFGNRSISSQSRLLTDGTVENLCPCRDNQERGIICAHVIALGLELIRRNTDPEREQKRIEENRRAAKLAKVDQATYLKRTTQAAPGSLPLRLHLELATDWIPRMAGGHIPLRCMAETAQGLVPVDRLPLAATYAVDKKDEALLFVLEDICEGPVRGQVELLVPDFINLLQLWMGRPLRIEGRAEPCVINAPRMASVLRMDLDHENGELILMVHTELPFMRPGEFPVYAVGGRHGWVYGAGNFWPLENLLPGPLRSIYDKPIAVPRPSVPRFLQSELPLLEQHIRVETDLGIDLFTIEPEEPVFRLLMKGSPASLAGTLMADYGDVSLVAGRADAAGLFSHPDAQDLLRYTVRNLACEKSALERLHPSGLRGEAGDALAPIVGCREVLNFLGRDLPALRREGWKVDLDQRVGGFMDELDMVTPVVRVDEGQGGDWFEVGFQFESPGAGSITQAEIQRALLKGESYIERGGRTILLDSGAITSLNDVFRDCASGEGGKPGSFRMSGIYASYVKSSLDALDGVDVEAATPWRMSAERQNRDLTMEPVTLPDSLSSILRPYQRDGINWLRFMEKNHFCGILADEMGLGKTLQALAWLQLPRLNGGAGKPVLIVCPTSLVENWAEEARKFTPDLKVITIQGGERQPLLASIPQHHLAVTSYALLRRDIEHYHRMEFSTVVLDEAQHIKNKSTQNALAAKRLKATHRLVLTGTPIENSVADLWSIMDFLMPGYLGPYDNFRLHYELPISAGGPGADAPQLKLRRKLNPFLLRRLKRDVAKDLPDRIERMAFCSLSPDQQAVYKQLLESSQRKLFDLVAAQGFQKSRMEILKTLLRLRQVCCHVDLLKLPDLQCKYPSAKLDLFLELLDEAADAGHRVLVFSQFVSMLTILRTELDKRGLAYCYLDGSTTERMKEVHRFNRNRDIPVFLISLKAGGSGLNLTGADMVIHFDPWWNPAVEDQATDRAHRIGQKRTVYSVKLITKGTVEEKVLELQRRKKVVIDATLASDEQVMGKLTWDDVQELLTL